MYQCPLCGNPVAASARFCNRCGHGLAGPANSASPLAQPLQQRAAAPPNPPGSVPVIYAPSPIVGFAPKKPGKLLAIAILSLVAGIMNVLMCVFLILTICGAPLGIYAGIVGVFELIYAAKTLPDPVKTDYLDKRLAIMQIVNIISCNMFSLIAGILTLIYFEDSEIRAYFATVNGNNGSLQR